jgi:hypothetical protein
LEDRDDQDGWKEFFDTRWRLIRAVSIAVPFVGFCVFTEMLWRLLWRLKHARHWPAGPAFFVQVVASKSDARKVNL